MEVDSIQTHARLETYYWWFVGRRKILEKMLQKYFGGKNLEILDWGCGPGGNFPVLSKFGRVTGVDLSDEALRLCREKGFNNVAKAGTLEEFSVLPVNQGNGKYDLITAFDVLEHIGDDVKFLKDVKNLLKPGGHILMTVPAYQFLWSELDIVLKHYRRYRAGEVSSKLEGAGYEVKKISYFMSFLAPLIFVYRTGRKIFGLEDQPKFTYIEFPRFINNLFIKLNYLEAVLMNFVRLPFGISIIVLAKKRE